MLSNRGMTSPQLTLCTNIRSDVPLIKGGGAFPPIRQKRGQYLIADYCTLCSALIINIVGWKWPIIQSHDNNVCRIYQLIKSNRQ